MESNKIEVLPNGNTITYQITASGTAYHAETHPRIVEILETARVTRQRLTIHYGDAKTGKAWGDVFSCYIGRSGGEIKIPLQIANSRSHGGVSILDHCIVKIETSKGKRPLWTHI